jgi:Zn-dependent peptidase ImmA (M78 family)
MVGERIKHARLMRRMSQRDLASRLNLSATAISKYEQGLVVPNSSSLLQLAHALDVGVEFFVRPRLVQGIAPAFQKSSCLARKEEAALVASIREWLERYLEAESILSLQPPRFVRPEGFPRSVSTFEDVERAAVDLRSQWKLGLDPIENLIQLVEDRGIKVHLAEADKAVDAFTFEAQADGILPVIVLRSGLPGDRMRFSLAHELGHLLLRSTGDLSAERAANRFAGALLVPEEAARFELGEHRRGLGLYELHLLKHKYGLSMQAWIYRAKDLGIISYPLFRDLNKEFRTHGWHKEEPGCPYPAERPARFDLLVLQALAEGRISERRAGELLGKPFQVFRREVSKEHVGLTVGLCDG